MPLESGIFKRYKKKFVVDEDALRRIEGLLKKASLEYTKKLNIVYRVEREDDRFYETHDLQDVLNDPNVGEKKIQILIVELREIDTEDSTIKGEQRSIVTIAFDNENDPPMIKRDIILKISCADRTWALLLADEIEPQIIRLLKAKHTPRWILLMLFLPISPLLYKFGHYLDGDKFKPIVGVLFSALIIVLIWAFLFIIPKLIGVPGWFTKYFGPESVFLWGDEQQESNSREQLRRNIQWGVIVAFIVSFSASMATLLF